MTFNVLLVYCRLYPVRNENLTEQQNRRCPTLAGIDSKVVPTAQKKGDIFASYSTSGIAPVSKEKTYSQAFAIKHHMATKPVKMPDQDYLDELEAKKGFEALLKKLNSPLITGKNPDREVGEELREMLTFKKGSKKNNDIQSLSKSQVPDRSCLHHSIKDGVEEENRENIEHDETSTVSSKISDIASQKSTELLSQQKSQQLLQSSKDGAQVDNQESCVAADDLNVAVKNSHLEEYPGDTTTLPHRVALSVSVPINIPRQRPKKKRHSSGPTLPVQTLFPLHERCDVHHQNRPQPYNKRSIATADVDFSYGGPERLPQGPEQALLHKPVHSKPEQAVQMALQSLASDDWENKCEGLGMISSLAHHYPSLLQAQLFIVLNSVEKEVSWAGPSIQTF